MSYNWNVYKLFKNGKRAKAPFHVFEYDDPESVGEYFNEQIKEKFTEKLRGARVMILRDDLPQSREDDKVDKVEKKLQKQKNRVIAKYLKTIDTSSLTSSRLAGGLILCSQSGWKWQWAALEASTNQYLVGLSPTFRGVADAEEWMLNEINSL